MSSTSPERLRDENAADFMGAGFARELRHDRRRRLAYQFWYHPLVELAIFGLVLLSILLLIVEIAVTDGTAAGWLNALSTHVDRSFFFWSDIVITSILAAEYGSKLWITPKGRRWFFIRHTWIELLSLLPILRVFRLFRIFRTVRLFRLMRILRTLRLLRASNFLSHFFKGLGEGFPRQRGGNAIILTYFISTMLFGTLGITIFERGVGSGIDSFSDALWWAVVTLSTVGYGDLVPHTAGGRVIAGIVMVLGLGFWSIMIGVFTTSLVERARNKETMGLDILGIHDHIAVLGWNPNGPRLIADLRNTVPHHHIVVITDQETLEIPIDARLHHLRKSIENPDDLELAQLDRARAVALLSPDSPGVSDADAKTLLRTLKLRRRHPDLHLTVELRDEAHAAHARSLGADDVIITHRHGGSLLAQTLRTPAIHRAFDNIFDVAAGSRFALLAPHTTWLGQPLATAIPDIMARTGAAPVGVLREHQVLVSPGDLLLQADDQILVLEPASDLLEPLHDHSA